MTKPRIVKVSDFLNFAPSAKEFKNIISQVKEGATFVYPTETIYGIGGIPKKSVEESIYRAKVRKPDNPMLLIASSVQHFDSLGLFFNDTVKKLAKRFWPGNLTMILSHTNKNKKTGIRVSDHPFIKKLCDAINMPVYSTSANTSGEDYVNDIEVIKSIFCRSVDLIFDMGTLPPSKPSTVVMVKDKGVQVLREGVISKNDILLSI